MGLDWRPINRPKPGFEKEFEKLFFQIKNYKKAETEYIDKLRGINPITQEQLIDRFFTISIPPYITLNAPCVGYNKNATVWAENKFEDRKDKSQTFEQFMNIMQGYYVVDLVIENDGIPVYIALHDERHVFRAEFLNQCKDILGENILAEAYTSKLSMEAIDFGNKLTQIADKYANEYKCIYLKYQRIPPETDEDQPESKIHIIYSAAKWLIWWGKNNHGYEADF
jgi:hypothetical protein